MKPTQSLPDDERFSGSSCLFLAGLMAPGSVAHASDKSHFVYLAKEKGIVIIAGGCGVPLTC